MEALAGMDMSGMMSMVGTVLKSLTDEQLEQAIELIKAEQASRLNK